MRLSPEPRSSHDIPNSVGPSLGAKNTGSSCCKCCECKSIAIEGRVERVEFKNPHNLFVLRLDDGTAYAVDWVNVTWLTRDGIIGAAKDAVVSGARVAVSGYLIRDAAELRRLAPKFKGDVNPNTVEARSLRRVDDSFSWPVPLSPRATPPNCDRK